MKLEKILVVEDTATHIEDAKRFFEDIPEVSVIYAENLIDAKRELVYERSEDNPEWYARIKEFKSDLGIDPNDLHATISEKQRELIVQYGKELENKGVPRNFKQSKKLVDAVISDLFFPMTRDNSNQQAYGVMMAIECDKHKIPIVINTAGYHHGEKYEFPNQVLRAMGHQMVDCYNPNNKNWESPHKNWKQAYETLLEKCQ